MQIPPELPTYNPYAALTSRLEDFPTRILQLPTRCCRFDIRTVRPDPGEGQMREFFNRALFLDVRTDYSKPSVKIANGSGTFNFVLISTFSEISPTIRTRNNSVPSAATQPSLPLA